jgi:hypothetical protein
VKQIFIGLLVLCIAGMLWAISIGNNGVSVVCGLLAALLTRIVINSVSASSGGTYRRTSRSFRWLGFTLLGLASAWVFVVGLFLPAVSQRNVSIVYGGGIALLVVGIVVLAISDTREIAKSTRDWFRSRRK